MKSLVIQRRIAGFRYHDAASVFESMRIGDALTLVREPDNPHDANAIRVEWNGRTLGYVPRAENARVARQLDQGVPLAARMSRDFPLGRFYKFP